MLCLFKVKDLIRFLFIRKSFVCVCLFLTIFSFLYLSSVPLSPKQAVRVTKPNIPESIRRNYELMWVYENFLHVVCNSC